MKNVIFTIAIIICLYASSGESLAMEQGIGIYPPIIKIKADPGADIKVPIRIKNLTESQIETDIILRPFKSDEQGNINLVLHKDYTPENLAILKNVTVSESDQNLSRISLSPHQEKTLSLRIQIPDNQKKADYYFSLTYLSNSSEKTDNTHSGINIGTATNVLLSVGRSSDTRIEGFDSSFLKGEGRLSFTVEIENNGAHFSTLHPTVTIKNIFGKIIEIISLGEHNLLQKTSKSLVAESKKEYLFGPYKAYLSLDRNKEADTSREVTILVMPGKMVLGITILAFLGIVTFIRVRKRVKGPK